MHLENYATVYEGKKILDNYFLKKKLVDEKSIAILTTNEIKQDQINLTDSTPYFKESTYSKYYKADIQLFLLQYQDVLYDKQSHTIYFHQLHSEKRILISDDFIIIRPELMNYIIQFFENESGLKFLELEIKKILESSFQDKLGKIECIHIPETLSNLDVQLQENERPDKQKLNEIDISNINIRQGVMTLFNIIRRIEKGEINVQSDTYFQRREGLWTTDIKSRFIEALIVEQPVPAFYFDATNDDKWLVVDGLQRISAVKEFVIDQSFKLQDLYYLSQEKYEGKTFDELPRGVQRKIEEYEIIAYKIEKPTPSVVKYKIFRSINTSPLVLSNQEIRHALNQKEEYHDFDPSTRVKELTKLSIFNKLFLKEEKYYKALTPRQIARMGDRELVLRYLAFRMIHYENYYPTITEFLDDAMTELYKVSEESFQQYKTEFGEALFTIEKIFGSTAFTRGMFGIQDDKGFLNNLFEAVTYHFAILSEEQREFLRSHNALLRKNVAELKNDEKFKKAISPDYATTKESVKNRFSIFGQTIQNTLG